MTTAGTISGIANNHATIALADRRQVSVKAENVSDGARVGDRGMFDDGRSAGVEFRRDGSFVVEKEGA